MLEYINTPPHTDHDTYTRTYCEQAYSAFFHVSRDVFSQRENVYSNEGHTYGYLSSRDFLVWLVLFMLQNSFLTFPTRQVSSRERGLGLEGKTSENQIELYGVFGIPGSAVAFFLLFIFIEPGTAALARFGLSCFFDREPNERKRVLSRHFWTHVKKH